MLEGGLHPTKIYAQNGRILPHRFWNARIPPPDLANSRGVQSVT